jgi:hypothetical protein
MSLSRAPHIVEHDYYFISIIISKISWRFERYFTMHATLFINTNRPDSFSALLAE